MPTVTEFSEEEFRVSAVLGDSRGKHTTHDARFERGSSCSRRLECPGKDTTHDARYQASDTRIRITLGKQRFFCFIFPKIEALHW